VPPATIAFGVATPLWGVYSRDVERPGRRAAPWLQRHELFRFARTAAA